jgi:hypothetical protein
MTLAKEIAMLALYQNTVIETFLLAKLGRQLIFSKDWLNKLWYIHIIKFYDPLF